MASSGIICETFHRKISGENESKAMERKAEKKAKMRTGQKRLCPVGNDPMTGKKLSHGRGLKSDPRRQILGTILSRQKTERSRRGGTGFEGVKKKINDEDLRGSTERKNKIRGGCRREPREVAKTGHVKGRGLDIHSRCRGVKEKKQSTGYVEWYPKNMGDKNGK